MTDVEGGIFESEAVAVAVFILAFGCLLDDGERMCVCTCGFSGFVVVIRGVRGEVGSLDRQICSVCERNVRKCICGIWEG